MGTQKFFLGRTYVGSSLWYTLSLQYRRRNSLLASFASYIFGISQLIFWYRAGSPQPGVAFVEWWIKGFVFPLNHNFVWDQNEKLLFLIFPLFLHHSWMVSRNIAPTCERETDKLVIISDPIQHNTHDHSRSLNCVKWIPVPGQGIVYATNTGLLKILR